jgi:DNA-binding MarR family transcriptional regulator
MQIDPPASSPNAPFSTDMSKNLGYLFSRVKSQMTNLASQRTQTELGITGTQATMLYMISIGRCATAAELARHNGIDASAITRLLDRVERHGLLKRVRSSEDRRIVRLELTEAGQAVAARIPEIFCGVLDQLFVDFAPEELDVLRAMLNRIIVNGGDCAAQSGASTPDADESQEG